MTGFYLGVNISHDCICVEKLIRSFQYVKKKKALSHLTIKKDQIIEISRTFYIEALTVLPCTTNVRKYIIHDYLNYIQSQFIRYI